MLAALGPLGLGIDDLGCQNLPFGKLIGPDFLKYCRLRVCVRIEGSLWSFVADVEADDGAIEDEAELPRDCLCCLFLGGGGRISLEERLIEVELSSAASTGR